jgi:hypothetical protein
MGWKVVYMATPHKNGIDMNKVLGFVTMMVSMAMLTLSMVGVTILVYDVFNKGLANSLDGLLVKLIVLGIAFFFGWGIGLSSIRGFGNTLYSIVIKIYTWVCLSAVSALYLKIIQKMKDYDGLHFWAYLFMLLGGLFVLICLHLLLEDSYMGPFAAPLLVISVVHLFVIVIRYVFVEHPSGWNLLGDLTIFVVMISISGLMLAHLGILASTREWINELFSSENEDGEAEPETN